MNSLLESLSQQTPTVLAALTLATLILTFLVVRLLVQLRQLRRRWAELLSGSSGSSLELMLQDHLRERMRIQSLLEQAEARIAELEAKTATSKRHLGMVRYDAFEDVGGSQSFALAFYDDHGNGAVLNGIVGRTDCRVYCKPLVAGRSDRTLSQEESRAVEDAVSRAPRAVITT